MSDNNQFYKNPDPTKYSTVVINPGHTKNAIKVLGQCGLAASPPEDDRRKLVDCHPLLECKHQYLPMKRGDSNMSPVIPRLFMGMPSMMNAQEVTGYSLTRYVTKYIANMDKNTRTMFNTNIHDPKLIKMETKFLYNTKITSSVIGADKWFEKMWNKNHPQGRIISRHEMVQVLLGEPQVFTNLVFEMLSMAPLSECPGTVKHPTVHARPTDEDLELSQYRWQCGNDSIIFIIHPDQIHHELRGSLPQWRQFMTSQVILINNTFFSKVSLDKVTVYGMRPPEL